jgi:hypothetical protein
LGWFGFAGILTLQTEGRVEKYLRISLFFWAKLEHDVPFLLMTVTCNTFSQLQFLNLW